MSADSHEDIRKHVRVYLYVFAALMALTVITVAVSTVHLGHFGNVAAALVIATVKGSLVACFFMHLISERKMLYGILALTALFFIVLLLLPLGGQADQQGVPIHPPAKSAPAEHHVH